MKTEIIRRSPVVFASKALKVERRGDWKVTLEYENEGYGPFLVDLSHCSRWDFQDADVGTHRPQEVAVPAQPGRCNRGGQILINRMNNTQAAIWHLSGQAVDLPPEAGYTDVTEATLFLAILGPSAFDIAEQLSPLDLGNPAGNPPLLVQGPFAHVPCQIVVLSNDADSAAILLTCSRGYAHDMVSAILHAGKGYDIRPAGEAAFSRWLT